MILSGERDRPELMASGAKLSLGGTLHDPADPMGRMFLNILATFAEFEIDLLRTRTRAGMAVAPARANFKGKQPRLTAGQRPHLVPAAPVRRADHRRLGRDPATAP
ncbi:recombinase family protein [Streptomyces sp. NPDC017435]|uniref:recombinase family protein n=1 Tax=Streptomyces sp. NPDC017435 TaxID=3364995 RepID=UPI0037980D04